MWREEGWRGESAIDAAISYPPCARVEFYTLALSPLSRFTFCLRSYSLTRVTSQTGFMRGNGVSLLSLRDLDRGAVLTSLCCPQVNVARILPYSAVQVSSLLRFPFTPH